MFGSHLWAERCTSMGWSVARLWPWFWDEALGSIKRVCGLEAERVEGTDTGHVCKGRGCHLCH